MALYTGRILKLTKAEALKLAKHTIAPETGEMIRIVAVNSKPGEIIELGPLQGLSFLHIMTAMERAKIEIR